LLRILEQIKNNPCLAAEEQSLKFSIKVVNNQPVAYLGRRVHCAMPPPTLWAME